MAEVPVVQIPGGGRSGETLIILAVLAGGAFFLWRRGAFDRPSADRPRRLPAAAGPPPSPPGGRPPPVMDTPKPTSSALTTPPPDPALAAALQQHIVATGAGTGASSGLTFKPAPVSAPPGVIGSATVNIPSPFGKRKPVATVLTQDAYASMLAKPAPVAPPPAPAPPKPAPLISPFSAAASASGAFGAFRPPVVAGASFAMKAAAPVAPAPAAKPSLGSALNPKRFF